MSSPRQRLFLDENIPYKLAASLRFVFKQATFSSHREEALTSTLDVPLFKELGERGFTGIITQDYNHLINKLERDGLRDARLHWIGLRQPETRGIMYQAELVSALASILPELILNPRDVPHVYKVTTNRVALTAQPIIEPV